MRGEAPPGFWFSNLRLGMCGFASLITFSCAAPPPILVQPTDGIDLLACSRGCERIRRLFRGVRRSGMKARSILAIALLGIFASVLSCTKGSSGEISIGEYGSLTGTTATFGQSTHNGILMAFDEINKAGGVLGKKLKNYVEDDQSRPEEAATAATKLINQNHVVALLGEVASSRSLAAAPICQAASIPMVSPSSTNPRVTQVGNFIYRVCFIDPFQGKVMAKFAANTLKVKKVAILVDVRNDYSVGLQTFFRDNFKQLGGTIVSEQSYSEGDSDFHAQLTQIKSANPEAIYVPGYYTEVGTI